MSSFLELDELGWGKIKDKTDIQIHTLDQFCLEHAIDHVDILKIDTQGFDFEVIRGAETLINENKVGLLYFEIIVSNQYKNLYKVGDVFNYLTDRGFKLITLYPFSMQKGLASWTDGLFIHESRLRV